jgi:hypothetical protein
MRKALAVAVVVAASVMMAAQTTGLPKPQYSKAKLLSILDHTDQALRSYQRTLDAYGNLPLLEATAEKDGRVFLVAGRALVLVRTRLSRKPASVQPFELASLFANVDSAAINASLSAAVLLSEAELTHNEREFKAAHELTDHVRTLSSCSDALWDVIEFHTKDEPARKVQE